MCTTETRLQLHQWLTDIFKSYELWRWSPFNFEEDTTEEAIAEEAERHVYFQPPPSVHLVYPCIIYRWDDDRNKHADNRRYISHKVYLLTVIDQDPDSGLPDRVAELPFCKHTRNYTADNLYHSVYQLTL